MAAKTLPPLSYLGECFAYDPTTGVLTWRVRPRDHFDTDKVWRIFNTKFAGKTAGTGRRTAITFAGSHWFASRIIYKMMTNEEPPQVDHRDGDDSNNRWRNLRAATNAQNCMNRGGRNKRGNPKGVCRTGSRWRAYIKHNYRLIHLGCFATPEAASDAYYAAAQRRFGEFARKG